MGSLIFGKTPAIPIAQEPAVEAAATREDTGADIAVGSTAAKDKRTSGKTKKKTTGTRTGDTGLSSLASIGGTGISI